MNQEFKNIKRFFLKYKKEVFYALVSLIAIASLMLSFGIALKHLVDHGIKDPESLNKLIIYSVILAISLGLASFLRSYFINVLAEKVIGDIRKYIYSKLIYYSPEFFETKKTGDIISRLTNDTQLILNSFAFILSSGIRNMIVTVGSIIFMFRISSSLALIMATSILFILPLIVIFGKKVRYFSKSNQEKLSLLGSDIEETFNAIRTIQSFSIEKEKIQNFYNLSSLTLESGIIRLRYRALFFSSVIIINILLIILLLSIGIKYINQNFISSGDLISFLYFAGQGSIAFASLTEIYSDLQRALAASARIFELDIPDESKIVENATHLNDFSIKFNSVSFIYPNSKLKILDNFNLEIMPAEFIGIVGSSGVGKSSIFQLLLKFFNVSTGKIEIGGVNISAIDRHYLRKLVAVVPQEPFIFSATAFENIKMALPSAKDDEIYMAARLAGIDEYINSLPEKFNSFLGEKGVMLSGGQKQRIAIARALLKKPEIILLDEATSALDTPNETLVLNSVKEVMKGKIIISIAHRIATIKNADKIFVIEAGKVIAAGKHKELLETCELYKTLTLKQEDETKVT